MQRIMLTMLTGCFAICASIGFTFAPVSAHSATPTVAVDRAAIEDLVRRYYEIAASEELDALSEVLAPRFTIKNAPPGEDAGLDGLILSLERARVSRPDFAFHVDDLMVDGNTVVVRTTISGTHLGDFFGMPPTGKWIEIPAIDLWRVNDGKLAAVWHFEDILGMMEQVGMVPGGNAIADDDVSLATPLAVAGGISASTPEAAAVAANAVLAKRFRNENFEQGGQTVADEILAPGVVRHDGFPPGIEGVITSAAGVRAAFPDLTFTVDHIIAEGDQVAIMWTLQGSHQGEFLGAAATGNTVSTSGIDIYRITGGQIAEIWTVSDDLGLLFQLGAFPEPTNGTASTPQR